MTEEQKEKLKELEEDIKDAENRLKQDEEDLAYQQKAVCRSKVNLADAIIALDKAKKEYGGEK